MPLEGLGARTVESSSGHLKALWEVDTGGPHGCQQDSPSSFTTSAPEQLLPWGSTLLCALRLPR